MSYIYGLNILADKLRGSLSPLGTRLKTLRFDWNGVKGTPRLYETYRGYRRNASRDIRKAQLWSRRHDS
jgi:hypothetical protein